MFLKDVKHFVSESEESLNSREVGREELHIRILAQLDESLTQLDLWPRVFIRFHGVLYNFAPFNGCHLITLLMEELESECQLLRHFIEFKINIGIDNLENGILHINHKDILFLLREHRLWVMDFQDFHQFIHQFVKL